MNQAVIEALLLENDSAKRLSLLYQYYLHKNPNIYDIVKSNHGLFNIMIQNQNDEFPDKVVFATKVCLLEHFSCVLYDIFGYTENVLNAQDLIVCVFPKLKNTYLWNNGSTIIFQLFNNYDLSKLADKLFELFGTQFLEHKIIAAKLPVIEYKQLQIMENYKHFENEQKFSYSSN